MNLPEPKFAIGEKILLRSISTPSANGPYVVLDRWWNVLHWGYSIGRVGANGHDRWHESALRPYPNHIASDESFHDLMERFSKPVMDYS